MARGTDTGLADQHGGKKRGRELCAPPRTCFASREPEPRPGARVAWAPRSQQAGAVGPGGQARGKTAASELDGGQGQLSGALGGLCLLLGGEGEAEALQGVQELTGLSPTEQTPAVVCP